MTPNRELTIVRIVAVIITILVVLLFIIGTAYGGQCADNCGSNYKACILDCDLNNPISRCEKDCASSRDCCLNTCKGKPCERAGICSECGNITVPRCEPASHGKEWRRASRDYWRCVEVKLKT